MYSTPWSWYRNGWPSGNSPGYADGVGKLGDLLEPLRLRIELGEPALVDLEHLADLGVDREHPLASLAILEDDQSRDPGRAFAGHRGRRAGEALVVEEVAQVDADLGLEPALAGQSEVAPGTWKLPSG